MLSSNQAFSPITKAWLSDDIQEGAVLLSEYTYSQKVAYFIVGAIAGMSEIQCQPYFASWPRANTAR